MNVTLIRLIGTVVLALFTVYAASLDPGMRLVIGIIVGVPSFILIIVGRRQLGTSFSVKPAAKALVTSGLYSRIQHPLYFFLDLWLIGVIVAFGWRILVVPWLVLVLVHIFQARREEKVLAAAFGAEYETYRQGTWF